MLTNSENRKNNQCLGNRTKLLRFKTSWVRVFSSKNTILGGFQNSLPVIGDSGRIGFGWHQSKKHFQVNFCGRQHSKVKRLPPSQVDLLDKVVLPCLAPSRGVTLWFVLCFILQDNKTGGPILFLDINKWFFLYIYS